MYHRNYVELDVRSKILKAHDPLRCDSTSEYIV